MKPDDVPKAHHKAAQRTAGHGVCRRHDGVAWVPGTPKVSSRVAVHATTFNIGQDKEVVTSILQMQPLRREVVSLDAIRCTGIDSGWQLWSGNRLLMFNLSCITIIFLKTF